jgi:mevalonate kinase
MADNGAAFLQPPPRTSSTSSHGTQTPEASPIDTMAPQLEAQLPEVASTEKLGAPALQRKKSSPMMPPFMVSAPGKVIVYGEHAVVHGKVCCMHQRDLRHN